jgi:hypothetical protein
MTIPLYLSRKLAPRRPASMIMILSWDQPVVNAASTTKVLYIEDRFAEIPSCRVHSPRASSIPSVFATADSAFSIFQRF